MPHWSSLSLVLGIAAPPPPRKNSTNFQAPLFAYRGSCFPPCRGLGLVPVGGGVPSRLIYEPAVVVKPGSNSPAKAGFH